jgi:hypothetical protein
MAESRPSKNDLPAPPSKASRHGEVGPVESILLVPNETVGWLIGKAGNSVAEIQRNSGASVSIEKEDEMKHRATRSFLVDGLSDAIQMAPLHLPQCHT